MSVLTLTEAQVWMKRLADPGKYGWKPEFRKVHTLVNRSTRKRFQKNITPSGIPWKPGAKPPALRVGEPAFFGMDRRAGSVRFGKPIVRVIKKAKQKRIAKRFQRKQLKKLLYRRGGPRPATKLFKAMTRPGDNMHIFKFGKDWMQVGTDLPVARKQQFGDAGSELPSRMFYGMSHDDLQKVDDIFADGFVKRMMYLADHPAAISL